MHGNVQKLELEPEEQRFLVDKEVCLLLSKLDSLNKDEIKVKLNYIKNINSGRLKYYD